MKYNNVEVNSNYVNKLIKATILSDAEMRRIGFTDYSKDYWHFSKEIKFPNEKKYHGFNDEFTISFYVTIPKDGSDIDINVLDDAFCQPYDYQRILYNNPKFKVALIVKEQVEKWMAYLQENGVLSGHVYGEYI